MPHMDGFATLEKLKQLPSLCSVRFVVLTDMESAEFDDLAERLRNGWPLAEANRPTYYTRCGETGYTDFPGYKLGAAAHTL